jgi:hypothetical protein
VWTALRWQGLLGHAARLGRCHDAIFGHVAAKPPKLAQIFKEDRVSVILLKAVQAR